MVRDTICQKLRLQPAEFFMLLVSLATLTIDAILIILNDARIDVAAYGSLLALAIFVSSLGMFYRITGRSERIASAAMCSAIFIFFSACLSLFNYLLLPLHTPLLDPVLTAWDKMFGYHWPSVLAWAAENPWPTLIFKWAYMSTIPQFAALVVILGLGGRLKELHIMISSITITATLTICFWGIAPSVGPGTIYDISPEIWAAIGAVADKNYSMEIAGLAITGPEVISPTEIRGLIAFPSYHAVLAFTAMYAARTVRFVGPVFFLINLLIIPGIFIHGSHHLVDLFAGFAMFAFGTWLSFKAVNKDYSRLNKPEFVTV